MTNSTFGTGDKPKEKPDPRVKEDRIWALIYGHTSSKDECRYYSHDLSSRCKLDPFTFRAWDCEGRVFVNGFCCESFLDQMEHRDIYMWQYWFEPVTEGAIRKKIDDWLQAIKDNASMRGVIVVFPDAEKTSQAKEIIRKANLGLGKRVWVFSDAEWESDMVDMLVIGEPR
ncbi:MAG: hypothetical protein WED04_04945 [Promethearchaeati archaeon SRVP18_Atabeyarchaeia-1]